MRKIIFAEADEYPVVAIIEDELLDQLGAVVESALEGQGARFSTRSASSVRKAAARDRVSSLA